MTSQVASKPQVRSLAVISGSKGYRTHGTSAYPAVHARSGVLFRADSPAKATPDDVAVLESVGVVRVIDLRGDSEIHGFETGPRSAARVHLPVSTPPTACSPHCAGRTSHQTRPNRMHAMYRAIVGDDAHGGY
jgi:protein-tyrosine phosphatase family protein